MALIDTQQTMDAYFPPPVVSVLDVLPTRMVAPTYSFLRQSRRILLAALVAERSAKPTSTVFVVAVENQLRMVARSSEQISHYLLTEVVNLERFVADELRHSRRKASLIYQQQVYDRDVAVADALSA